MSVTCNALAILPSRAPESESVRPDTVFYYRSMHVDELENAIGGMLRRTRGGLGRVDAELRDRLLPALMVLREKVQPGEWQRFLRAHKLNPDTVRQWRARQKATTTSLLRLFGEPPPIRSTKMPRSETATEALLKAAARTCEELLRGNVKYASKLAAEFLEAYASL
jgi:hypothetical protein